VLGLLLVGYLGSQALRLPVSAVAGGSALLLLLFAQGSPAVDVKRLVVEAPWKIVVFSIGMYVVVFGLRNAGLTALVAHALTWAAARGQLAGILFAGYLAAVLSSIMNNMPTVMVGALAIQGAAVHGGAQQAMALANVIGSDLGPKITPIGSLATLLWLHVLERRGVKIGWGYYFRVGVVLTVPVLLLTLLALHLVLAVRG
jgi:arsenical pump membrane protein